ncbi:MAG: TIGR04053 family radical SAM/SPASM domain-containing protein [Acidobacteria bacterium]|nr:TIGR04053 family radical SAM/SPASM domain-containing protein [Acidobacteriota bacterium]
MHHSQGPRHGARDYAKTPLNIYWEMTQACALACRHCRAEAMPEPHPNELSHEEGLAFLRQIPDFGEPLPHLILTGGDPLARKDLFEVIDEARRLGIGISITPAATEALTRDVLVKLKEHGVEGLGLSLDGSTAARHDAIRGVPGTFDRTMRALGWAKELEIPTQVNTLVAAQTAGDAPDVYELLKPFDIARWSLFFLISVGRGKVLEPLEPAQGEKLMRWIYDTSLESPFIVATTEAPSYRRVALERKRESGNAEETKRSGVTRGFGIRDGHGIMFVSNTGDICPAGFLPVTAGNVKSDRVIDIYRDSPLFQKLHDPTQFEGRCGVCEYHILCGGSRARAYGATGNPFAEDPFCPYEPAVKIQPVRT